MEKYQPAKVNDIVEKLTSPHRSSVEDGTRLVAIDVLNGDDSAVVINKNGEVETLWYPDQYRVVGNVSEKLEEMRGNFYQAEPMDKERVKKFYKDNFNLDMEIE